MQIVLLARFGALWCQIWVTFTQYGGRYGKDTDTNYDEVINDDGIAHRGIERKLEIEYETVRHGCTKVYAKIV